MVKQEDLVVLMFAVLYSLFKFSGESTINIWVCLTMKKQRLLFLLKIIPFGVFSHPGCLILLRFLFSVTTHPAQLSSCPGVLFTTYKWRLLYVLLGIFLPKGKKNCWPLFSLWLCLFILSGVISPLFILSNYQPWEFVFQCHIFLPFHTVHGVLVARILGKFAISFLQSELICQNSSL